MNAFETELGLISELAQAVDDMGWLLPTDIQSEAIPLILGGGDVLMAAETGSGKTGAFCLPVLQIVYETLCEIQGKTTKIQKKEEAVTMNNFDKTDGFAINSDGTTCQSSHPKNWNGARATKGATDNACVYYECKILSDGLCRVGWSTEVASLDLGTDAEGYGYGGTGKKSNNRNFDNYGESFTQGDVIGCCLNLETGVIGWSKNGKYLGNAYKLPQVLLSEAIFPAISLKCCTISLNFGDKPFEYDLPRGFEAFSLCNKLVSSNKSSKNSSKREKLAPNAPLCIVLEPSRELAEQTFQQFKAFKSHLQTEIRECLIIGGVSVKQQIEELHFTGAHIVVATPGRLEDLISQKELLLNSVRFLVLDEVDGLLNAGYKDMIVRLHSGIPQFSSTSRLQMIVCSATLHNFDVRKLAESIMHFPTWIDLKGQDTVPETVHHCVCMICPKEDESWRTSKTVRIQTDGVHSGDRLDLANDQSREVLSEAVKILKAQYIVNAIVHFKMDKCLIFCRTKLDCDNLERLFIQLGGGPRKPGHQFSCVCLHSDRNVKERGANLKAFKDGKVRLLICTDVAARGIDIAGLPFVINVTLPDDKQNYVHRIGRVGRAERMGLAISLCATVPEKVWYHTCPSRGRGCHDTRLTSAGGCCIWYTEKIYLSEIEEHLGVTIPTVGKDFDVPVDEYEGKVTYGQKKAANPKNVYEGHADFLAPLVQQLAELEKRAQMKFLELKQKVVINQIV